MLLTQLRTCTMASVCLNVLCIFSSRCPFTCAPWNLYVITNLAYALFIAAPNSHVHQVHMCIMKCLWHRLTYASWNLYNEIVLTQFRKVHHEISMPSRTLHIHIHRIANAHVHHDMCPTSHMRIHTTFTCAPWDVSVADSHVQYEISTMMSIIQALPTVVLPDLRHCVDCKWTIADTLTCAQRKAKDYIG